MKKILAIATLALGVAVSAAAQPKAIGGRLGLGIEASYEHCVGSPNFFEVDLGLDMESLAHDSFGFQATATYNFVIAQPDWTSRGDWQFYAGPGVSLGWLNDKVVYHDKDLDVKGSHWDDGFMVGICGQVGLSYTFWFPLQLAVDIRPVVGLHINDGWSDDDGNRYGSKVGFYNKGISWCWIPTLAVRYAF